MKRLIFRIVLVIFLLAILGCAGAAGTLAYFLLPEMAKYEPQVLALKDRQAVGHGWQFHSRVYSQALMLTVGTPVSMDIMEDELTARDYLPVKSSGTRKESRKDKRKDETPSDEALLPGTYRTLSRGYEISLRGFDLPGTSAPAAVVTVLFENRKIKEVKGPTGAGAEVVYALEPMLLAELLGDDNPRRATFVPLSRIPKSVQDAVLASEDSRFETHHGVDFRGILRAITRNVQAGGYKQGASTITQQLARTLFLSTERTWKRKVSEIALALQLDKHLPKDQLLELYLNSVYLGQQEGVAIHGVEEAARAYFNKPVTSLDLAESATLSGIIPAPNAYNPFRYPDRARERRDIVLGLMRDQGRADAAAVEAALKTPVKPEAGKPAPLRYGYYTGFVREFLKRTLGEGYELKGLSIYSAMDPVVQTHFEASLVKHVDSIGRRFGSQPEPLMGAALMLDYHTGQVLAIAGGRGYDKNPFNRAFQSHRQPGSSFKPIAYATALEGGEGLPRYTAGSLLPDQRRSFQVKEGEWKPRNYEGDYHDTVTIAKALTKSLNVATVNLVDQVGPQRVAEMAKKLGLGELKPVLSIGLGTNAETLEQMVRAYATFASGGLEVIPQPVEKVVDLWGKTLYEPAPPSKRLLKTETTDVMVDLLRSVVIYGTSWTLRTQGYYPRPSAGKTGTSQDEQDAWYIGFTPDVLMGVWVGYDTPRHLYGSAADVAVPVWGGIMTDMTGDQPVKDFQTPEDMEYVWIDPYTGGRATSFCPRNMRVGFLKGTAPKESCPKTHEGEEVEAEGGGEGSGGSTDAGDEGVVPGSAEGEGGAGAAPGGSTEPVANPAAAAPVKPEGANGPQ